MPLLALIVIFIVVPLAELYVIWQVGEAIGVAGAATRGGRRRRERFDVEGTATEVRDDPRRLPR